MRGGPIRLRLWLVLPALSFLSYATSFLRERYLIQRALGLESLDGAVAAYAAAAMIGNFYAMALGIAWVDGRPIPRWASSFAIYGMGGALLCLVWPTGGSCIVLASLVAGFEFSRQRAAFRGRQISVVIAAAVAPAASIVCWVRFGTDSLVAIIGGYAAGFAVQTGAAWLSARHAKPLSGQAMGRRVSVVWPFLFAGMTQLNGLLDRLVLPYSGPGWAGASAFAFNLTSAALLIIVAPLASEAVAGRLTHRPTGRFMIGVVAASLAGAVAVPFVLPHVIGGGLVRGQNLGRVEAFTVLYLIALPGYGYWTFRARALQTTSRQWRPVCRVACAMLGVHVAIAVPAVALSLPYGAAVGSVVSTYVGVVLLMRCVADDPSSRTAT